MSTTATAMAAACVAMLDAFIVLLLVERGGHGVGGRIDSHTVTLHSRAAAFEAPPQPASFLDTLRSFENQSLWRYFHCDGDGEWISEGLVNGTLLIVHDGSYMAKVDKTVCSAGYMIYCVATKQKCKGAVAERSNSADNYRAEILGGLVVQLILRAATSNSLDSSFQPVQIDCDNLGVVRHGNSPTRALKEKQAQADILRCFKQLVTEQPLDVNFHWVPSHQDDHKEWEELTALERINVVVDKLAKKALLAAIQEEQEFISSAFPFEHLRVELGGEKVTSSPRNAFEKYWSHGVAQKLYHEKKIVSSAEFNLIWWDGAEKEKTCNQEAGYWWAGKSFYKAFEDEGQVMERVGTLGKHGRPGKGKGSSKNLYLHLCRPHILTQ